LASSVSSGSSEGDEAVVAGMDGLRRDLDLDLDQAIAVDPDQLSQTERDERGIRPLPRTLAEAVDALEADKELRGMLGSELEACWFSVKRAEIDRFAAASPSEIVEAYAHVY